MDAQHLPRSTGRGARLTIGMDAGDRFSHMCMLDPAGEIVEEARIRTKGDPEQKAGIGA